MYLKIKKFLRTIHMNLENDNYKAFRNILEMLSHVATIAGMAALIFASLSYKVSQDQLKIMEYQNSPKFRINVSVEPVDNVYDRFIQVTNLGEPIETKIDTHAIMTVQLQNKGKNKEINILLKDYFYENTDMIENGTSLTGVLCRRGTNLCDSYIQSTMQKIKQTFISRKIPLTYNITYFTRITYKNYDGQEVSKYKLVGDFKNQDIEKSDFDKLLNTKKSLDVGNYLNSPIGDDLMDILLKTLS